MKRAILMYSILVAAVGCGSNHATTGDDTATDAGLDDAAKLRKARVVNTLGQGLSLREGPGQEHAVLLVMPEGSIVDVLSGPVDGWYQVTYEETTGWASADYLAIFGSDDPPPGTAGFNFMLPWQAGVKFTCTQGHNGGSHTDYNAYAWDFGMPVGTPIVAANSGVVRATKGDSTGGGCSPAFVDEANYVVVTRSDGFESLYVHLSAVTVPVGAVVRRGDLIGYSGQTGYSCGAHLHYQVQPGPDVGGTSFFANPSVPSAFHDSGTAYDPVSGDVLTSQNSATSDVP
jgi:hypothetical protein